MNFRKFFWILVLTFMQYHQPVSPASFFDWIGFGGGKAAEEPTAVSNGVPLMNVPYEEASREEKFLQEAAKFIALHKSELDSCQHKVVMKIQSSCGSISDEELAKLSVNLLNCQSAVEGRQQFPCTEDMSLRQCTSSMDSDMWNTYHLMNNRARAVCYAARHQHFRALSEMTVNKLMTTAHHQLEAMNALQSGQEKLETLTTDTLESISQGHKSLLAEQEKLHSTQKSVHSFVALNLRELTREKALIAAGQKELALMTKEVKSKLDSASKQLSEQSVERQQNHQKVLDDLESLQAKATEIWERIDSSTQQIMAQHAAAAYNLEETLNNLAKINATVEFLLNLVEKTRVKIDERLGWIIAFIGDTGEQLEWMHVCFQHSLFLVLAMVTLSFVQAPLATRVALLFIVPMNLVVTGRDGKDKALDLPGVAIVLTAFAVVHWVLMQVYNVFRPSTSAEYSPQEILWLANNLQSATQSNGVASTPARSPEPRPKTSPIWSRVYCFVKSKVSAWFAEVKELALDAFEEVRNWFQSPSSRDENASTRGRDETDRSVINESIHSRNSDDEGSITNELRLRANHTMSPQLSRFLDDNRSYTPVRSASPGASSTYSGSSFRSGGSRIQCSGLTRAGLPCRNFAISGNDMCRTHSTSGLVRSP